MSKKKAAEAEAVDTTAADVESAVAEAQAVAKEAEAQAKEAEAVAADLRATADQLAADAVEAANPPIPAGTPRIKFEGAGFHQVEEGEQRERRLLIGGLNYEHVSDVVDQDEVVWVYRQM